MMHCDRCKVTIGDSSARCPLCHGHLSGENPGAPIFPKIGLTYPKSPLFFKLLALITVTALGIAFTIRLSYSSSSRWFWYALAGSACGWASLLLAIYKRKNVLVTVTYQTALFALFALAWDALTGWRNWSINYAIPSLFIFSMVVMAILPIIIKIPITDCFVCFTVEILYGLIPSIFLVTGIATVRLPSLCCVVLSVIALFALILFEGKPMLAEVKRRFHL